MGCAPETSSSPRLTTVPEVVISMGAKTPVWSITRAPASKLVTTLDISNTTSPLASSSRVIS